MSELISLAERCEQAAGPDPQLDQDIHDALFRGPILSEDETAAITATGGTAFSGCFAWHGSLTFSLDAATKLVPEEWTAWGIWSRQRKTRFYAVISRLRDDFEDDELDEEEDVRSRRCVTPALALCAAGLRAHAASVDTHPEGGDAKQGSVHG